MLDRLGWHIEEVTRRTMSVADGREVVPLGRIRELPIQFGKIIILIEAVVVDTTTYDLIISND
jgi:hypothetical protein